MCQGLESHADPFCLPTAAPWEPGARWGILQRPPFPSPRPRKSHSTTQSGAGLKKGLQEGCPQARPSHTVLTGQAGAPEEHAGGQDWALCWGLVLSRARRAGKSGSWGHQAPPGATSYLQEGEGCPLELLRALRGLDEAHEARLPDLQHEERGGDALRDTRTGPPRCWENNNATPPTAAKPCTPCKAADGLTRVPPSAFPTSWDRDQPRPRPARPCSTSPRPPRAGAGGATRVPASSSPSSAAPPAAGSLP